MLTNRRTYAQRNPGRYTRQTAWYAYWRKGHIQRQIENQAAKTR